MTFSELASRSLRLIGAIDPSEAPPATELINIRMACNSMLKSWAARKIVAYVQTQSTFALPASTASITIGTGGDVNIDTPHNVDQAWLRINDTDYSLQEIDLDRYNDWGNKDTTGIPQFFAVRKGFPLWTMYFKVKPDSAFTLFLETRQPFTEFTSNEQVIALPGEYEDALAFNLAVRIAPEYQTQVSQEVMGLAVACLSVVKNKNSHPIKSVSSSPFVTKPRITLTGS
jgi:hypothetical protein